MTDKFVLSDLSYLHSLKFRSVSVSDEAKYVCVLFNKDAPIGHQSAHLRVLTKQQQIQADQRSNVRTQSLPNLTIVLAVLGSIVLILLGVLILLLCNPRGKKRSYSLPPSQKNQYYETQKSSAARQLKPSVRFQCDN